ncbi:MAG: amidohydrolase family protein, partial [Acidimicrobiales bacterium]
AAEVRRLAARGFHAVTIPQHVGAYGQPPWQDPHWDPLWRACADEAIVINVHIGTGGGVPVPSDLTTYLATNTMLAFDTNRFAADFLFSRVLADFPTLVVALSEGGIGWVPFALERFDDTYARQRAWTGDDLGDLRPSDVYRRNFRACFIRDRVGIEMRDRIGIETICWELDYPHSDSSWPDAPEQLAEELAGCSDDEVEMITWRNAANTFRLDTVERLGRDACMVKALRSRITNTDFSAPKVDRDRIGRPGIRPVNYGDMRKRMSTILTGGR